MTTAIAKPLNIREQTALQRCERIIEQGCQTFLEVGRALMQIRDEQLYRGTHKSFRAYCEQQWGFDASRARQLIGGVERAKRLESVTTVTPARESQTRPLAKLPEDQQAAAWADAVDKAGGEQPTAAQVQESVDLYLADNEPYEPDEEDEEETPPPPSKRPKRKKPKQGRQKRDPRLWGEIEQYLGKALNRVDSLHKAYPNKPMHATLLTQIKQAMATLRGWKESLK
jgi:hypothetical protein